MGLVPKKTKVGYHVFRHINMVKVVGFIMTLALSAMLSKLFVMPKLGVLFEIFCCVEFLVLSGGSPSDPTKCFAAAYHACKMRAVMCRRSFIKEPESMSLKRRPLRYRS